MIHASLFSGIGGPEIAAAMLGWQNAFHCEINDFGRKILEYWFPESESYKDVKTTNFTKWRGQIDILTGGFPCQPFSYAGQRKGADDDRYLWPEFKRVISEIRPTWVVGENVAGITTMVEQSKITTMESQAALFDESDRIYRYKYEQPFTIQRVCADLEALQYSVQPIIIPACAVGAPHRRDRVFIIATNSDSEGLEGNGGQELQSRQGGQAADEHATHSSSEAIVNSERIRRVAGTNDDGLSEASQQGERELGGADCPPNWWRSFPSVSPIHRGNDGIPFDVDRLTLSFGKWRTEALKAYGNAIVPQIMYEIFKFIEQIEND